MTPLDVILWALAVLVVAIVTLVVWALIEFAAEGLAHAIATRRAKAEEADDE